MGWRRCAVGAWLVLACACGGSAGTAPDAAPPATLAMTAPAASAEVFGAVRLAARIDGGTADHVVFYLDTATTANRIGEASADSDGVYAVTWFAGQVANGSHAIVAQASVSAQTIEAMVSVDVQNRTRNELIPAAAVKQTPAVDAHPPNLEPGFADMFEPCVPLVGPVNTAGAEDAPYITADGQELYIFFTPDASVPPSLQLVDRVTGIYRSVRDGGGWSTPERVYLSHHDDPALDGCETVFGDEMWFCTVRAGVERSIDIYVATRDGDHWSDWQSVGQRLNLDLELGELHIADAGDTIYYHSERAGGLGGADIWVTHKVGGQWQDAENVTVVNSSFPDGWPWVSADGTELWFTRGTPAPEIWRSVSVAGVWQAPEKVVGPFAGEPTFDGDGNLYFAHHFWDDGANAIIEADIYVCMRK